jgi:hypothetical protein
MANEDEIKKSADNHAANFLRKLNAGGFRDDTSIDRRNPRPKKKTKGGIYYERQNNFQDQ